MDPGSTLFLSEFEQQDRLTDSRIDVVPVVESAARFQDNAPAEEEAASSTAETPSASEAAAMAAPLGTKENPAAPREPGDDSAAEQKKANGHPARPNDVTIPVTFSMSCKPSCSLIRDNTVCRLGSLLARRL